MIGEAIAYFKSKKKELKDFRKIYPSPDTVGYQATTKEISFYDMAISALSELDNEGEWIEDENFLVDDDGRSVVKCSKCGEYHGYSRTSFCPNCGAKMKGE